MKYLRAIDVRYTNFDATSGLERIHGENSEHVLKKLMAWIAENRENKTPLLIVDITEA